MRNVAFGLVSALGLVACDGGEVEPLCNPADEVLVFEDADGDGFGAKTIGYRCSIEVGQALNNVDCDDTNALVFPSAAETCDDLDNDCDGSVDEGFAPQTYYADVDNDSFGDADTRLRTCDDPGVGFVRNAEDCDDNSSDVSPTQVEVCDNYLDDDCDGVVDNIFEDRCQDGKDDNCNGLIDCADPSCNTNPGCLYECTNIVLPSELPILGRTFDTNDWSPDFDVPTGCADGSTYFYMDAPDVVFQWRSPITGTIRIDTTGSEFDTVLSVYREECAGNPSPFICNDDGPAGETSVVTLTVVEGEALAILVDGITKGFYATNDRGAGLLNIIEL